AYIGSLPEHFERWAPHRKYVSAHVGKIYPVNWKVAQEAFMEAFHVVGTHPQIAVATADMNSHYDCFGNFSRAITANGSPSPHLRWTPTEQEIFDALTDRRLDQDIIATVPEAMTARAFTAMLARKRNAKAVPGVETWCDAEMVDSMYFTLFPNFHPWGAFNRINYRFRPVDRRVDQSLMECIYTDDFVGERPPPAPMRLLGLDERWSDAIDELGLLAKVFEQDSFNLPAVQAGLEAMGDRPVTLTRYQELKIRHFHHLLEAHLGHAVDPYR
ncbi:MAG: RHO alpha subunit C-terminal catalytic domain-containing protein, partial [Acidimicrobiia bacterium]|nr:RHO alpha subunit C-terminal catalytic domain-containing protein [Acidimicrobiia bacterium]